MRGHPTKRDFGLKLYQGLIVLSQLSGGILRTVVVCWRVKGKEKKKEIVCERKGNDMHSNVNTENKMRLHNETILLLYFNCVPKAGELCPL